MTHRHDRQPAAGRAFATGQQSARSLPGWVTLLALVAIHASTGRGSAEGTKTFAIRFVVADVDGVPVVDESWLRVRVEQANEIFAPSPVRFVLGSRESHRGRAEIVTRGHRHELSLVAQPRVINAFVVASLADVDRRGEEIRGVHWRSRRGCQGAPSCERHYVILSRISGPTVLAHELGHFFGNPHSDTPGNIMSYERAEVPPFFDALQLRRIRQFSERFLGSGELVPAL